MTKGSQIQDSGGTKGYEKKKWNSQSQANGHSLQPYQKIKDKQS